MTEKTNIPLYQLLWAKTNQDQTAIHPLICHLIDVAQVTRAIWDLVLTEGVRKQLAASLALDPDGAGQVISFWAGLHDLGKACPAFQVQHGRSAKALASAGLPFPPPIMRELCYHSTVSALVLKEALGEVGLPSRLAERIARAAGGHHGSWPVTADIQALKQQIQIGGEEWASVRRDLTRALHDLVSPPAVTTLGETRETENALLTLLSGLISAADWVGSMESYFPYAQPPLNLADYTVRSATQARDALAKLGWVSWRPPKEPTSFLTLFRLKPRVAQEAVIALAERLTRPALVIIEAPTGIGKTEAALYLADRWAHACQQRGLYVAMPTMSTSNQMFERVRSVLARRYPEGLVNLHLLHGQAAWREDVRALRMETIDELKGRESNLAAMAWFLPRKRGLLAPFGVGTVDQALLSVLQTRHFFVRLFGLCHKTIIFDEVHAYDTYMSTLFQRLLSWLRVIGASVVLLSATLPKETRRQLLRAYAGAPDASLPEAPYPAITWAMDGEVGVVPLTAEGSHTLQIQWIAREPQSTVQRLAAELREGGCAAIICNTVRRAQEIYRAFKEAHLVPPEDLILFHARFPLAWRDEIEQKVLSRFGKGGERPHRAIVVATQVIEQSLDLDFDLMVSDLAPIDLVLQRAGRLYRHPETRRPAHLGGTPYLFLVMPENREDVPTFASDALIYEPYVLLRSYLALQGRDHLTLPDETTALIEAVYGDEPLIPELTPALANALQEARQKMQRHEDDHVSKARQKLIPPPQCDKLMEQRSQALEEDSPELHEAFQALTRISPPSVSLVCLHRTAQGLATEPDGTGVVVDLEQIPDADMTMQLVQHAVNVTYHSQLVRHFLEQLPPRAWREHPLLRSYRVLIFDDGCCHVEGTHYTLHLSREYGLEIEREER